MEFKEGKTPNVDLNELTNKLKSNDFDLAYLENSFKGILSSKLKAKELKTFVEFLQTIKSDDSNLNKFIKAVLFWDFDNRVLQKYGEYVLLKDKGNYYNFYKYENKDRFANFDFYEIVKINHKKTLINKSDLNKFEKQMSEILSQNLKEFNYIYSVSPKMFIQQGGDGYYSSGNTYYEYNPNNEMTFSNFKERYKNSYLAYIQIKLTDKTLKEVENAIKANKSFVLSTKNVDWEGQELLEYIGRDINGLGIQNPKSVNKGQIVLNVSGRSENLKSYIDELSKAKLLMFNYFYELRDDIQTNIEVLKKFPNLIVVIVKDNDEVLDPYFNKYVFIQN